MKPTRTFTVAAAMCCMLGFGLSYAQERTWAKGYQQVKFSATEVIAEYTHIRTRDGQYPHKARILYKDEEDNLLVIRKEQLNQDGEGSIIIERVVDSEKLEFILASGQITVNLGTETMTITDHEPPFNQQAKSDGLAFLSHVSQAFKDELEDLARIGSYHSLEFYVEAVLLRELFFHNLSENITDVTTTESEFDSDFDPDVTPPGTFDQQFGQAFYE